VDVGGKKKKFWREKVWIGYFGRKTSRLIIEKWKSNRNCLCFRILRFGLGRAFRFQKCISASEFCVSGSEFRWPLCATVQMVRM